MIMVKVTKQQICHKLCSNLAMLLPIILVLAFLFSIFFFSVSVSSSPSLLTLLIALLSTLFLFTLAKKKGSLDASCVQDNMQKSELQSSLGDVTNTTSTTQQSETAQKEAEVHSKYSFPLDGESSNIMDTSFELNAEMYEKQADPESDTSFPSDSESSTSSTMGGEESIEIHHNRDQNLQISDSLVFDNGDDEEEDGLIEIRLPNNHFSEFFSESIFKQQGLTELLTEFNEINDDENLIEIDIFKGSAKHQDLRLKKELVC